MEFFFKECSSNCISFTTEPEGSVPLMLKPVIEHNPEAVSYTLSSSHLLLGVTMAVFQMLHQNCALTRKLPVKNDGKI
jgi:hypothetical protein